MITTASATTVPRRTLGDLLRETVGAERFDHAREYSVKDFAQHYLPTFSKPACALVHALERVETPSNVSWYQSAYSSLAQMTASGVRAIGDECAYDFAVDALAQNISSLPFIFNDKYAGHKSWRAAAATRLTALFGNSVIGRPYGVYQDWFLGRAYTDLGISTDTIPVRRKLKHWAASTTAFATGQTWIYAIYLKIGDLLTGQHSSLRDIATAAVTLTVLAPLIGPVQEYGYKYIRREFTPTRDASL